MQYILKNDILTVTLDSVGAELISVKRGACEYIWSGDARYWDEHAPIMFPTCGRLWGGTYTHHGKTYEMGLHGFARGRAFAAERVGEAELTFVLSANEETRRFYPFAFRLSVTYRLEGESLLIQACIENRGEELMPATFGLHPGFSVPLDGKGSFDDWYLEFSEECSPDAMLLSGVCYRSGVKRGMVLEEGRRIRLSHRLFDEEGVFMHRVTDSVVLKSEASPRFVSLSYPDMPYLGIWQPAQTDAPFVCIEPWCGFVGYDGVTEELSEKPDMFRIRPHSQKDIRCRIRFG